MEGKLRFKIEKISVYGEYNFSPGGISISIIIFNPRTTTIRMLQFPVFSFSGCERSGHGAGTSEYHVRSYHHVRGERL